MYIVWLENHQQTPHVNLGRLVFMVWKRIWSGARMPIALCRVRSLPPATSTLGQWDMATWLKRPKPFTGHNYKFRKMLVFYCWCSHNHAQSTLLLHVAVVSGDRILMAKILLALGPLATSNMLLSSLPKQLSDVIDRLPAGLSQLESHRNCMKWSTRGVAARCQ